MGVAIDQARRDPAAFAVDDLGAGRRGRGEVGFGTGKGDFAAACGDGAAFDDAQAGRLGGKRRKPGVAPDARSRLRCLLSGHDFSVPIGVDYVYTYGERLQAGFGRVDAIRLVESRFGCLSRPPLSCRHLPQGGRSAGR